MPLTKQLYAKRGAAIYDYEAAAEYNRKTGRRLAALRRSRGMSQAEAAKELGITQGGLSQYENGQRTISCSTAMALIKLYDARLEDVFGGDVSLSGVSDSGAGLLEKLAERSGSSEIRSAVEAYSLSAAYRMLRALYECNPHNSGQLFDIEFEDAMQRTEEMLREEPYRISSLIHAGTKIDRSRIELPVECSAELREFIDTCEGLIGGEKHPTE